MIVKKAMRSEPDVHSLGMTDLAVISLGATDLTSLCLCKHLFPHQLLSNTSICFCTESRVSGVESRPYALKLLRSFTFMKTKLIKITTLDYTFSGAVSHEI